MLKQIAYLYLQRQILEANFESLSLRHYLQTAKPPTDNSLRLRLRESLLYIYALRQHHPERETQP